MRQLILDFKEIERKLNSMKPDFDHQTGFFGMVLNLHQETAITDPQYHDLLVVWHLRNKAINSNMPFDLTDTDKYALENTKNWLKTWV